MRHVTIANPPLFALTERTRGRITLTADTGAVANLFVLEDDIVRLLLLANGTVTSPPSWAIAAGAEDIAEPGRDRMDVAGFACPEALVEKTDGTLVVATARIRVTIALHGLHCRWEQHDGAAWQPIAADRPTQAYDFGWWDGRAHHFLERRAGDRHYALGERAGAMDRTGRRFRLTSLDPMGYDAELSDPLYKAIPYVLVADAAGRCHGEFHDTLARVTYDFGQELDNYHGPYRHVVADHGDVDLWMIAGPDPLAVTKRFTWLTGRPALMPAWSLGYSGSTMTYTDAPDAAVQMQSFTAKLAEHDIGCTSFHLSSGYTSIGDKRYVFHWNRDKFPDPAAFVKSYADAGVRLVPNIKPAMLLDHPLIDEVRECGLLVADADGVETQAQFWDAPGVYLDFTNPAAAAWWKTQVTTALLDTGIEATWNDNNEYEVWDARARIHGFGTPRAAAEALPLQALLMMRASRAAQIAHAPGRRPYVVTRSGMTGLQRYAQTWSGDNRTDWKTLRYNLKMGLGLALSGISNSGHDVGGFAGPPPDAELLVRWVQAGVLMPRFSIHSWNDDRSVNEPWMHAEALPAIQRLMALRQTLLPFFGDLLLRYSHDFEPIVRPVWLDHPGDAAAWIDGDDHMLGRDVLAAIVVEHGAATRTVRLPGRDDWYDVWSGTRHAGGAVIEVDAPLAGNPPLFARAGSAMFVDLAQGGFAPAPRDRGLWLFPPAGEGDFTVSAFEDDETRQEPRVWRITGQCTADAITLTIAAADAYPLTIVLPHGEERGVAISGARIEERHDVIGRRALRITG
ncbi:TIM-barrel domain-containing protein [Sphingomonas sp. PWP1-2]|uniref:glycoside hydrolase family 31 protein n=1 Tax=Sphingomonas sp. PWP1-2 TaxID=2804558 RepID=UPI003CF01218